MRRYRDVVKTEVLREIQNDVEICVVLPRRLVVACNSERATSRLPAHAALRLWVQNAKFRTQAACTSQHDSQISDDTSTSPEIRVVALIPVYTAIC